MTIHYLTPRPRYWTEEDDMDGITYVCFWSGQLHKADSLPLLWSVIGLNLPVPTPHQRIAA